MIPFLHSVSDEYAIRLCQNTLPIRMLQFIKRIEATINAHNCDISHVKNERLHVLLHLIANSLLVHIPFTRR